MGQSRANALIFRPFAKRGLYERFQRTRQTLRLNPRETVLVGLSGGRDSVVLLHLLIADGISVVAAHVNHQLRGSESRQDEIFVRNLCKEWGIPLAVKRANIRLLAKKHRLSIEEAARIARYRFFVECAKKRKLRKILVAHHERDQAETILLKIFQGTTREHLGGIKMQREMPLLEWSKRSVLSRNRPKLELIRPLLEAPFEEMVLYAKQNRLPFREDSSNRDLTIQRNWIRHRLIPLIQRRMNRNVVKTLVRLAR